MKFTKKAFRKALKYNDRTEVWHLSAIYLGRTPTRREVSDLVEKFSSTLRDFKKAYKFAYGLRESKNTVNKIVHPRYSISIDKEHALHMLRKLLTEDNGSYTKVPMMGFTHLYFCSPVYGHKDYNKVSSCKIEGNEKFCERILEIAERFMKRNNINKI